MAEQFESIRSQLRHIVYRMCDIADGSLKAEPIGYEELKALADETQIATREASDPQNKTFLELVAGLVTDMQKRPEGGPVFQFKVCLHGDNRVWRRIQLPEQELSGLVEALLNLGGWESDESYSLEINHGRYVHPEEVGWEYSLEDLCIGQVLGRPPVYGHLVRGGQDWLDLVYEGYCHFERGQHYPRCIDGRGAFPTEEEMCTWVKAVRQARSLIAEPTGPAPRIAQNNGIESGTGFAPDTSTNT